MPSDKPQATPFHIFEVSKLTSSHHDNASLWSKCTTWQLKDRDMDRLKQL
jgi:hypothetical protein